MVLPLALLCAKFPTFKYFIIPDGYSEIDIHSPEVQEAYEFGKKVCPLFLDDFVGPHHITLIHAWHKEEGNFYAVEVMRLRIRYLIKVQTMPDGKHYIHSVRILNEEGPTGAHWFVPDDDLVDYVMQSLKKGYGDDLELIHVAVFKTVMRGDTHGQMVIDCKKGDERMLVNVSLFKKFGEEDLRVSKFERVY